jgi:Domain of unknown function (DUF4145)
METCQAPCARCRRYTSHNILTSVTTTVEYLDERYELLQCGGCNAVSMSHLYLLPVPDEPVTYYPSPNFRSPPLWFENVLARFLADKEEQKQLSQIPYDLLHEIYDAVGGGQLRLATMGIRSVIEHVMIAKIGDQGSFAKHLDMFYKGGFISLIQHDTLDALLEAGHATAHRGFHPTEDEVNTLLDILEGVLEAIYIHSSQAQALAKRIPPRSQKRGRTGQPE